MTVNSPIDEGSPVALTAVSSDPGADDQNLTYTVYWNDGTIVTSTVLSGDTINENHVYTDDGNYDVILNITDSDISTVIDTRTTTINNVAPVRGALLLRLS